MTDVFAPQSPTDPRDVVRSFNSDGSANFEQVGFEELDFSAVFGGKTTSTTTNSIAYGIKTFTLDSDDGKIQVGYPLQCLSLDDSDCWMQGVVVRKDTVTVSPAEIDIAITILSPLVNTTNNWELQVVPVAGFSINPSATVGISTTSIDASGAGPFTFTTQTDKLFMQTSAINGSVICTALTDPKTYLFARVSAVNGTSLVVEKIYSNATVAISAWSIQMFDGPDTGLSFYQIDGLLVTEYTTGFTGISILPGSVMDSTGTLALTLNETLNKSFDSLFAAGDGQGCIVQSSNLTGTISINGATHQITGSGTLFLTELDGSTSAQFDEQGGSFPSAYKPTIATSVQTGAVSSVSSDTSALTTFSTNETNVTYKRNGTFANILTSASVYYFIHLIRNDSTGAIDICAVSASVSGEPDLPSGWSLNRLIAAVWIQYNGVGSATFLRIEQPLYTTYQPFAPADANYLLFAADSKLTQALTVPSSTSVTRTLVGSTVEFRRAALTGDITASANSNATTIANDAVTYAKMQNVSAASKLLGRGSAGGAGNVEEITLGTNLTMTGTTLDATGGGGDASFNSPSVLLVAASL
jgi:hypothetical protein